MPQDLLASRVKQLVTAVSATPATGQGPLSLGAAYDSSVRRMNDACVSGALYPYMIKEGALWEYGFGTPTTGTPWTFARTTPIASSSGVGTRATFTTACVVWITPNEQDFSDRDVRGKQSIPVPAPAMYSRKTNPPAEGSIETATNKVMLKTWDFDATTAEYVQFALPMPKGWDLGTITFTPYWSHPATTTNFGVAWSLQAVAFNNANAFDAAFGTAVTVVDTGGATDTLYEGPVSAAMTIAGTPTAEEMVIFQLSRAPANGSDTLAVDARLHAIVLHLNFNASTDA